MAKQSPFLYLHSPFWGIFLLSLSVLRSQKCNCPGKSKECCLRINRHCEIKCSPHEQVLATEDACLGIVDAEYGDLICVVGKKM